VTSPSEDRTDPDRFVPVGSQIDWQALENIVHRDPARRGLASFRRQGLPLDAGALSAAAVHLAEKGTSVGIVTGFCARVDDNVTAETDGPPGALFLARALSALGIDVCLITDRYALPLVEMGRRMLPDDRCALVEFPFESEKSTDAGRAHNEAPFNTHTDRWVREFFARGAGERLSHLISIERPGPSHTTLSVSQQVRVGEPPLVRFAADVAAEDRDVCHNMRGRNINAFTAKTHRLSEWIAEHRLPITTIGIGDGGNEIGMGNFAWEVLVEAIGTEPAGRSACRIATDFTLVSGVSNWGAYALALAVAVLRGGSQRIDTCKSATERRIIETMVRETTAVDGITLQREPTVDGLSLDVYLEPLDAMQKLLGGI
jgi:hypothetical protein